MEESDLQRSPSLERLLRRRPSFSRPPIRTVYSARLTEDEAEMLTSPFLQYRTRYTYANSSCYDPDLPSSWEVPNLANAGLEINAPLSHIHLSAPGILQVVYLYILWIFEVITYFVKKIFTTLFREGPLSLAAVIYDFFHLIYIGCRSVVRRSGTLLLYLFSSITNLFRAESLEGDWFLEKLYQFITFPVRAVYWILDSTGRRVLNLFYGDMSGQRYNLRPYRPQGRSSVEPRRQSEQQDEDIEERVNFGGDESISSIDDEPAYLFDAPATSGRSRSQREVHNLRSRVIRDEFTDTEDEGFSEKRPVRVLHTSTPIRKTIRHSNAASYEDERHVGPPPSKAIQIAHALGAAASTVVTGIYWVLIEMLMITNRIFHSIKTGARRAVFGLTPKKNKKIMRTRVHESVRRSTRLQHAMGVDTDDDEPVYHEEIRATAHKPSLLQKVFAPFTILVALISSVLLGTARFFLASCFAVIDLCRIARDSTMKALHSAILGDTNNVKNVEVEDEEEEEREHKGLLLLAPFEYIGGKMLPVLATVGKVLLNIVLIPFAFVWWLGECLVSSLKSTRGRLLWLLPLLLLLLILLARNNDNEQYAAIGNRAREMKESVVSYVDDKWKSLDSEGVYANSINSIYDEYYSKGQYSVVGVVDRVKNFFGGILSFFANIFYSVFSLFGRILSFIWEFIIAILDFFIRSWRSFSLFLKGKVSALPTTESLKKSVYNFYESVPSVKGSMYNVYNSVPSVRNSVYQIYEAVPSVPPMLYPSYYAGYLPTKEGITNYSKWIVSLPVVFYNNMKSQEVMHKTVVVNGPTPPAPEPIVKVVEKIVEIHKEPVYIPAPAVEAPKVDEEKLIQEISAKVQADMEAKLEAFKLSYSKEMKEAQEINIKSTNVEVDYTHLEALIRQAIYQYDADKTGLFDYALESAGASVISTRCSESYNSYSRLEKIWNIPLWYSSYGPRTVIQRNSNSLFPGECWSFKSGRGYLTIDLSHHINISSVSYEHIAKDQAPDGNRSSAPKEFKLWAYKSENDFQSRFLLGSFEYKLDGHPLQFFVIKTQPDFPVKIIEMEVISNYGAEFTCLYRLRVHGQIYKAV